MKYKLGQYVRIKNPMYDHRIGMIGRVLAITYRHKSYVSGRTEYTIGFDDLYSVEDKESKELIPVDNDEVMVEEL